jgi:hypothetical protein
MLVPPSNLFRGAALAVGAFLLLAAPVADAAPNCATARAKVNAKYRACVDKWLVVCIQNDAKCLDDKLSSCNEKLAAAWPKLAALDEVPCSGDRWVDNGDGTVTDHLTDLVGYKKTDDGGIQDVDRTWTLSSGAPWPGDGTLFTQFLPGLGGLADSSDWRLPSLAELLSIVALPLPCSTERCIAPVFGAAADANLTSTGTAGTVGGGMWILYFRDGTTTGDFRSNPAAARAVRGGS